MWLRSKFISKTSVSEKNKTDYAKMDLRRKIFQGEELNSADFTEADLRYAQFLPGLGFFEENLGGDPAGCMHSLVREVEEEGGAYNVVEQGGNKVPCGLPDVFVVRGQRSSDVSLRGAKFEYADLRSAVIVGAHMTGASLRGAKFGGTVIDTDLSEVVGLNDVEHTGPSYLSLRAIRSLGNPLPVEFLKGCGLSDLEVTSAKLHYSALTNEQITDILYELFSIHNSKPIKYYSVFISYSHSDKEFAERLYEELQRKGIRCWYDEHSMKAGDDIYEAIDAGIKASDKILLCCSRSSLTSWWVDSEINRVFAKERKRMRDLEKKDFSLIPLDLDGYMFSEEWQNAKKADLHTRRAANFNNWCSVPESFDQGIGEIIDALACPRRILNSHLKTTT